MAPHLTNSKSNTELIASMFESSAALEGRSELTLQDFKIHRQLGSGAYAQVKLATHERTKVRVALKMYPKSKVNIGIRRKAV